MECVVCGQQIKTRSKKFCCEKCKQHFHYEKNKEKMKEYKKQHYLNNKEKYKENHERWLEENQDRWNEYQNEYQKMKRKEMKNNDLSGDLSAINV